LTDHLLERYGTRPVHSLEEISLLRSRFPKSIRLFEARIKSNVVAGVVIFESSMTAHVQYIAACQEGREIGALDGIFQHLIETIFVEKSYFDFGISNENEGLHLNIGLVAQKEGFGARAIVHDHYTINLANSRRAPEIIDEEK
jgi:hypothetical protein